MILAAKFVMFAMAVLVLAMLADKLDHADTEERRMIAILGAFTCMAIFLAGALQ